MSAKRTNIITTLGVWADETVGMVGTVAWQILDVWPVDDVGQQHIFPDRETTSRQIYRTLYTAVSLGALKNPSKPTWKLLYVPG